MPAQQIEDDTFSALVLARSRLGENDCDRHMYWCSRGHVRHLILTKIQQRPGEVAPRDKSAHMTAFREGRAIQNP